MRVLEARGYVFNVSYHGYNVAYGNELIAAAGSALGSVGLSPSQRRGNLKAHIAAAVRTAETDAARRALFSTF